METFKTITAELAKGFAPIPKWFWFGALLFIFFAGCFGSDRQQGAVEKGRPTLPGDGPALPDFQLNEPPERNRLTANDYAELMYLLPEDATKARK